MELTITSVQNYDMDKKGNLIKDNKGVQKYRSVIKTNEKGNDFLTGFVYRPLNVGDVIDATITQEQYNGMTQLRFAINPKARNMAQAAQSTSDVLSELKNHTVFLKGILDRVEAIHMAISTHQTIENLKPKEDKFTPEDLEWANEPSAREVSGPEDFGNHGAA